MSLDQYLQLLDWTGRQLRRDKAGSIPRDSAAILERLECSAETRVDFVRKLRKRFRSEAGLPQHRQQSRSRRREARLSFETSG